MIDRGKDNSRFLNHIIKSIDLINQYSSKMSKHDFFMEQEKQDAIVRRLEIIGEATKNLSEHFRKRYSDVPWKDMAGMRDRLIHEYFGVNLKVVWKTIKERLPEVQPLIEEILKKIENN